METQNSATLAWLTWLGLNSHVRQEQKRQERTLKEEVRRLVRERVNEQVKR